ncbi:MAG TPA: NUDIX domain-containing protein [Candidatus Solibacter sp.]|nr:NUDIX domain-containing protein [Candidatus Solibacter sp.]
MEPRDRQQIFDALDRWASTPEDGLPFELFQFLSRIVPLINVDLLITDPALGTLLTWRDDEHYGPGWHVPGGIIRYKETAEARLHLTARAELEADVEWDAEPIHVEQNIHPVRRERGHMISMLYRCRLTSPPAERLRLDPDAPAVGHWGWHRECPTDLILEQERYRRFL